MIFNNLNEAKEWFLKYKKLEEKVISFLYDYKPGDWKFGDYILIQHIRDGKEISRPILAIFLGFNIWDQAAVVEYVQNRRAWMHFNYVKTNYEGIVGKVSVGSYDILSERIQLWTDNIKVLGHWKNKPSITDLKKALKDKL